MLDPTIVEDIYPLTPLQEGMLFHYLEGGDSDQYVEQLSIEISGNLELHLFEESWNRVIAANAVLRTVFRWEDVKQPVQVVLKEYRIESCLVEGSGSSDSKEVVGQERKRQRREGFDLREVPFRVSLCNLGDSSFEMIVTNHHILYDGWSNGLLLKEFFECYEGLIHKTVRRTTPKTPFKKYIQWLRQQEATPQREFWNLYLAKVPANPSLAIKKVSPHNFFRGCHCNYRLPDIICRQLVDFSHMQKLTPAALFYTAWGLLLQGLNRSSDVIFGTTVSGRNASIEGIQDIVGLLINTIPLRLIADKNDRLLDILNDVQKHLHERERFSVASLTDIRQWCGFDPQEDLFDTLLVVENYPLELRLGENADSSLAVQSFSNSSRTNYDLTIGVSLLNEAIDIDFLFNSASLDEDIIRRMSRSLETILNCIVNEPLGKVGALDLVSPHEKKLLLESFNDSTGPILSDLSIVDLVEKQAVCSPDHIALISMQTNSQVSYRALFLSAGKIACALTKKGLDNDSIVCVHMNQSIDMAVGVLGVMMAGCAYLPIDPSCPEERIRFLIKDSHSFLCLTSLEIPSVEGELPGDSLLVRTILNLPDTGSDFSSKASSQSIAYVIYTSGTTGKPKGVAVEHQSVVNMLVFRRKEYQFGSKDTSLQLFSFTFDGFVASFFTPLVSGCRQVFSGPEGPKDLDQVLSSMRKAWVNNFICVPSIFHAILENLELAVVQALKLVVLAGDAIPQSLIDLATQANPGLEMVNEFGVTEASVLSTYNRNQQREVTITIGCPISNTKIFVIDHWGRVVPLGVPGEICISGAGLARGYLNRPELTAEKYREERGRIYCTGDLGRWDKDGRLEHLGRIDHQVKIRGLRIELQEIERQLSQLDQIKEAVVFVHETIDQEKFLCAYAVPRQETLEDPEILMALLAKTLPEYMIPRLIMPIQSIPLTATGKVDRNALPTPVFDVGDIGEGGVCDRLEMRLADIWADVLGICESDISRKSDFFHLGGHSIKATVLSARIHKKMKVKLSLEKIFKFPRLRDMARYIRNRSSIEHLPIEPVELKDCYPMSNAQRRLWIIHQMEDNHVAYNMTGVFRFSGKVRMDVLAASFETLIERHEILRTAFVEVRDNAQQRIYPIKSLNFSIQFMDMRQEEDGEFHAMRIAKMEAARPFDLTVAPLLNTLLMQIDIEEYIFVCTMHHIIADGWSIQVLVRDLFAIYNAYKISGANPLPPLGIQYKDFSFWHLKQLSESALRIHRDYWLDCFSGVISESNLPTDFPRPQVKTFNGKRVAFDVPPEWAEGMERLARTQGTSLFMVLLAVVNALLYTYTDDTDIVIGSPIAGRQHEDLIDQIGFYVNTLALRTRFKKNERFESLLQIVKEATLGAYAHQIYPFDYLIDDLGVRRDSGRNPLFDIVVALQSFDTHSILGEQTEFKIEPIDMDFEISTFDIVFLFEKEVGGLAHTILYNSDLYASETIDTLGKELLRLIREVIDEPGVCLDDLAIDSLSECREVSVDSWDMNF